MLVNAVVFALVAGALFSILGYLAMPSILGVILKTPAAREAAESYLGYRLIGVMSMAAFGRYVTLPGMVGLVALASVPTRTPRMAELQRRIKVGAVGGLVGVIGYDVVRVPFSAIGMRVFAPIDSYGLMLSGSHMASPYTNTLGWLFHLSNGVTFGQPLANGTASRNAKFAAVRTNGLPARRDGKPTRSIR